jgi:hemolysin activation/secretion protein
MKFLLSSAALIISLHPLHTLAQDSQFPTEQLRDSLQNETLSDRAEERARQGQMRRGESPDSPTDENEPTALVPKGGPCFPVNKITFSGHDVFGKAPLAIDHLVGRCVSASDLSKALQDINVYYKDAGFITTRAYLPEQNLRTGELKVQIIAGRIDGYVYSNGSQADRRVKGAFPTGRDDLLNLRDLEQGLDNMNAPRSATTRFQLLPGERPGGSFVQVIAKDDRRFHANLDTNNAGFKTTGVWKTSATLGVDNLFNANDQLRLGVTTTPFDPRHKRFSDSISLSGSVPMGNWNFSADAGFSRYFFILDGINQSYPVKGHTKHVTLTAERMLYRDQVSKYYGYGELKTTRTRTYIDSYEIESQRRNLTVGTLGLRSEHNLTNGKLSFDGGVKFGLDLFGSYVLDKSIVDPTFKLGFAKLDYQVPLPDTPLTYKTTLSGQYSPDILPGTEQFSVGGWANVRGYHDDNMYGDNGVYLQNTLEWQAYKDQDTDLKFNVGFDAGYLWPSQLRTWSQRHLTGVSVGTSLKIKDRVSLSGTLAHALSRPDDFNANRTVAYFGLGIKF